MKRFLASLALLCTTIILTMLLASGVAKACAGAITATSMDFSTTISCRYADETARYCYYNCTCRGQASQCGDL